MGSHQRITWSPYELVVQSEHMHLTVKAFVCPPDSLPASLGWALPPTSSLPSTASQDVTL